MQAKSDKMNVSAKRTYDLISSAMMSTTAAGKKTKFNSYVLCQEIKKDGASSLASATAATVALVTPNTSITMQKSTTAATKILTFTTKHDRFARLQLLSTHTLYDLVSALCQYTPIGFDGNEGPDDHLWYISYNGNEYESSDIDIECQSPLRANKTKLADLHVKIGSNLKLTYDYGTTTVYEMKLVATDESFEDTASFPRNQPLSGGIPTSYSKYQPEDSTNPSNSLDEHFPYLNHWIFDVASSVSVSLFQAGRKKNFGFMDNKFTMMYLPMKPDSLANWLQCFNVGASIKPAGVNEEGYTYYTWQSVVTLPQSKVTPQLMSKYKSNERRGFCDAPIVEDYAGALNIETMFPKIAALAGLKKDKKVPKGWITFTRRGNQCSLTICKGNAREPTKSKAPKGLAFEGENQHEAVDEPLFQISSNELDIHGLQDLFCVVEGLLRTL